MFDFPTAPISGQKYTPSAGITYQWNGIAWTLVPGVPQGAIASDTPPASPVANQLWWKSSTGVLYLWFTDANSSQWVQVSNAPGVPGTGDLNLQGYQLLGAKNLNGGPLGGVRNKIINGDFDIWQRATTQSTNGYGSDDRWANFHNGSTKVTSQQAHTLGQTLVPGNPTYFSRTVVTSVANVANYVIKTQNIDGVKTLSGRTVTATFWAKAAIAQSIGLEAYQDFGTGGSPSAGVSTPLGLIALTTAWQKFTKVFQMPSVAGKVLGTVGDKVGIVFWFDAGANFAARASNVGQQSGTFDISHVSLVEGDSSLEDDCFAARGYAHELAACQRFYQTLAMRGAGYGAGNTYVGGRQMLPVPMRAIPVGTYYDGAGTQTRFTIAGVNGATVSVGGINVDAVSATVDAVLNSAVVNTWWETNIRLDAEL